MEERLLLRLVTWGILFALAVAVALLRLQRLDELPPGLYGDVNRDGVAALGVLRGEHAIFFPDVGQSRDPLGIYVLALSTLLFGRTRFALHLPTALGGIGMVYGVFWMGRLLFGRGEGGEQATPWRGLLIGGVGAGLMAVSLSQTVLGRTGYNTSTHTPLLLILCLGLLWWGWSERGWRRVALAGVCAGLLSYAYPPARFALVLFVLFGLSFLLPLRALDWGKFRKELRWAALFAGVAALVAAPALVHFALHPDHLFLRSKHLWIFDPVHSQGDPLGTLLTNVWDHLSLLGLRGDLNPRYNYVGRPMLNAAEGLFFWIGVGAAVWRWRRPAYRLLLIWLVIMMIPAFVSRDHFGPNSMRILSATPAIYLLVGVGVWEGFSILSGRFFRRSGSWAAVAAGLVIGVAILVRGIDTYRTYYHKWAVAPGVFREYFMPWHYVLQALNARSSRADELYLFPYYAGLGYEYLYQGQGQIHLYDPWVNDPVLAREVATVLTNREELSSVKVLEWTSDPYWIGYEARRVAFLLRKYGRYLGSEENPDFRIHRFTEVSTERPWTFYELEPVTVKYDGGIALQGLALGQGAKQLPSRQPQELGQDRPLWMAMRWQTAPGLEVDYSISLRIYNVEGERVYQEDAVLRNRIGNPTRLWWSEEAFDFLTVLELAEDMLAGDYELRLVVYDLETQAATVEIGVWEAETTLARLRLADNR